MTYIETNQRIPGGLPLFAVGVTLLSVVRPAVIFPFLGRAVHAPMAPAGGEAQRGSARICRSQLPTKGAAVQSRKEVVAGARPTPSGRRRRTVGSASQFEKE